MKKALDKFFGRVNEFLDLAIRPVPYRSEKIFCPVQIFHVQNDASIGAGSAADVISEVVPNRLILKLEKFATFAEDAAFGSLIWTLNVNGTPIAPFTGNKSQIGIQFEMVSLPREFDIAGGSLVTVNIQNTGGAAYKGGAILEGVLGYYS